MSGWSIQEMTPETRSDRRITWYFYAAVIAYALAIYLHRHGEAQWQDLVAGAVRGSVHFGARFLFIVGIGLSFGYLPQFLLIFAIISFPAMLFVHWIGAGGHMGLADALNSAAIDLGETMLGAAIGIVVFTIPFHLCLYWYRGHSKRK